VKLIGRLSAGRIAMLVLGLWLLPQLVLAPLMSITTLSAPRRPLPPGAGALVLRELPAGTKLEEVSISAADGAVLRGWYLSPPIPNGAGVIALHGMGDNRLGMMEHARYLLAAGHPVLLPDGRAQGESDGAHVTYGRQEVDDMRRWVDLVRARRPGCVDGLGESLGAAVMLQSVQFFCAVVAEAPFESFREVAFDRMGQGFHTGPWLGQTIFRPGFEATALYIRLHYGVDLGKASPLEAIRGTQVPVLLIHGDADHNIPRRHCVDLKAADPAARLVEIPGADHTAGHRIAGTAFEGWVLDWFAQRGS
jgi:uncharacterized protein